MFDKNYLKFIWKGALNQPNVCNGINYFRIDQNFYTPCIEKAIKTTVQFIKSVNMYEVSKSQDMEV